MRTYTARSTSLASLLLATILAACGNGADYTLPQPLRETAVVAIVNPVVNTGHTAGGPTPGSARSGIVVDANPGGQATTDAAGLALLTQLTPGSIGLQVGDAPPLPFTVVAAGDIYDYAVAYDGSTATAFPSFPIRYDLAGRVVVIDGRSSPSAIADALSTDGNIVFFRNGIYVGDVSIPASHVTIVGEDLYGIQAVIAGSVSVNGTGARIRGITIGGNLNVPANDFGMSFSKVRGTTSLNGNTVALLRNVLCGSVTVPSATVSLLDNAGLDPITVPDGACP